MPPAWILGMALALGGELLPSNPNEQELSQAIRTPELRAHVYRLASHEFLGRRGPGGARASQHLATAFQRMGLKPAFGEDYFQPIPWRVTGKNGFLGRNVGGLIEGSDPGLRDEWILVAAHFDHLGQVKDQFFPGADDNASGLAMLLEVAEYFALAKVKPRRSIYFVSFDLEETGLLGSTHFATHLPRPIDKLKTVLVADMLGRSMANLMDEVVFVMGSETAPELRRVVDEVPTEEGLKLGRLGADLVGTRSDYGPFRDRRVPFLFLSTGQHPDYHRVTDLPDRIDYEKLRRICLWIVGVLNRLGNDTPTPTWAEDQGTPDLEEARTVYLLVSRVLEHPDVYPLKESQKESVRNVRDKLRGILDRGRMTTEERTWLVWTARLLLVTVF